MHVVHHVVYHFDWIFESFLRKFVTMKTFLCVNFGGSLSFKSLTSNKDLPCCMWQRVRVLRVSFIYYLKPSGWSDPLSANQALIRLPHIPQSLKIYLHLFRKNDSCIMTSVLWLSNKDFVDLLLLWLNILQKKDLPSKSNVFFPLTAGHFFHSFA